MLAVREAILSQSCIYLSVYYRQTNQHTIESISQFCSEGLSPSTEELILVRYYTFSSIMKTNSTSCFDLGKPAILDWQNKFSIDKEIFKTI